MRIERTFDSKVIDSVLKHKDIAPFIGDDSSGKLDINYPIVDSIYYLAIYDDSDIAGIFAFVVINGITLDGHTNILPRFRGEKSIEAARLGLKWVFDNTKFVKINGSTPIYNKRAIAFNKKIGFEVEGINKGSIMKDGKLYDQIYFGLERSKWA